LTRVALIGGPALDARLRPAHPALGRRRLVSRMSIVRVTPRLARFLRHVVEGVGVVGPQEMQSSNGDNHDQHDHSHEDFQDRSDHHTIPLTWPRGGASQTRAANYASLPLMCKHPR
jgi:hypothetical protein